MTHPLDDCRARLQRGRRQLQELEHEINLFIEREPYRVIGDFEREESKSFYVTRVHIVEHPSSDWAFLVGEIVANFRSSLDYLICALTLRNGRPVERKTAYPLFHDLNQFDGQRESYIGGLPESAQLLIRGWQPGGGDDRTAEGLSIVASLSNYDKHQALPIIGSVASVGEIRLVDLMGHTVDFTAEHVNLGSFEDDAELTRIDMSTIPIPSDQSALRFDADFTFQVAFGERGPCPGRPVIDCLMRVQQAAVFLTGYFEMYFAPGMTRVMFPNFGC